MALSEEVEGLEDGAEFGVKVGGVCVEGTTVEGYGCKSMSCWDGNID